MSETLRYWCALALCIAPTVTICDDALESVYVLWPVMLTRPTVSRPRPRPRPEVFKAKAKAKASHFKG